MQKYSFKLTEEYVETALFVKNKQEMEALSLRLAQEIAAIQRQISMEVDHPARGKEWKTKATTSLHIKKLQRKKLNMAITEVNQRNKARKAMAQKTKERIQNELFYEKLKELLPTAEFRKFLVECDEKISQLESEE